MRVLFVLLAFLTAVIGDLISSDETEELFRKYVRKQLTESENETLKDLLDIVRLPNGMDLESDIFSGQTRTTLACLVCRSAFATVSEAVSMGQQDDEISEIVVNLCENIGIASRAVCHGAVYLNIPIITYIMKTTPEATPRAFCGLVLQDQNPNSCSINDARFEWQVDLPARINTNAEPVYDDQPLKVALLTDAHLDPLYEANGLADCCEPTCCRKGQTCTNSNTFTQRIPESMYEDSIVIKNEQIMVNTNTASRIRMAKQIAPKIVTTRDTAPAGYWGDYRNCDSPVWAYDNVIETIRKDHQDVDMIYYIGDTIDHFVWETTYELINDMNLHLINKIKHEFGPNVVVLPTIGNHESQPTNQFAPQRVQEPYLNTTWLYDALAEKYNDYLTEEAKETLRKTGDFTILVRPKLRIISLNNNVAYKYNWWLVYDPLDAKNHLDWLIEVLSQAELAGERVHILTHIPPGVADLTHTWTREYNRIVSRFSSTIAAEFNGHTHSDEFKIFYSVEDGSPVNVAWGGGSATTYSFYNLNYKIITFDTATYEPQNIENYVYNLTEANLTPNRKPHWFQLYDVRNTYEVADLSAQSMHNFVQQSVTDKRHLLDLYSAFFSKMSDRWTHWGCDEDCKLNNICKTVTTVLWDNERCEQLRSMYFA